jgi:hypothetical protein
MCQKYDDYVYGQQYDNTYVQNVNYGLFTFVCGDGTKVDCPGTNSCEESCRILKGYKNTDAYSGVLSIRGVNFIDSYQSPIEANNLNLDFVVCFYHGNTLVSASIINAYTINSKRL